jgi:hypothetical protein
MGKAVVSCLHIIVDAVLVLAVVQRSPLFASIYLLVWMAFSLGLIYYWIRISADERIDISRSYVTTYGVLIIPELVVLLIGFGNKIQLYPLIGFGYLLGYYLNPFALKAILGWSRFYIKNR